MMIKGRIILWQDIMIIVAFILYFGAGFCTNFVLAEVGKYTEFAVQLESNPLAREALNYGYSIMMIQMMTIAILGCLYYIARRNMIIQKNERTYLLLSIYTVFVLMLFLQNILHDMPIALKLFLGG